MRDELAYGMMALLELSSFGFIILLMTKLILSGCSLWRHCLQVRKANTLLMKVTKRTLEAFLSRLLVYVNVETIFIQLPLIQHCNWIDFVNLQGPKSVKQRHAPCAP